MQIEKMISNYQKKHKLQKRIISCFLVLALLVGTVVSLQLHVTGISMTNEVQCGKEEHTHTEDCYQDGELVCGKEEHTHTVDCMSDQSADVETENDWKQTLPEHLTGTWAEDLVNVAVSQIGYKESTKNFTLSEDGATRKGYTRYGAWYGNEYGDWDAMFVSFCLYYADIPSTNFIYSAGSQVWKEKLTALEMYQDVSTYAPKKGDVIFLIENAESADTDQVGIVESVDESKIAVIQGDTEDSVERQEYARNDSRILGFGVLPENPEKMENDEQEDQSADEPTDISEVDSLAATQVDQATIDAINTKLGLKNYVITGGKKDISVDMSLGGAEFNKRFYYGNVSKDDRVPFNDATSYKAYLAQCYQNDQANGTDTLTTEWNKYLYDLFDPTYDQGSMGNTGNVYPDTPGVNGYGDPAPHISWPKDGGTGPFHATSDKVRNPKLNALKYDIKGQSVDYSELIRNFDKTVTADKAGDENTERKYKIGLSAKVQAAVSAPVVMVMQIQTSWQMFDLAHANCVKGDGTYASIAVGSCSRNSEIANLYDIKQALIRFVKDLNEKYPGNNLALAITDVEHGGTWSMLGPVGNKDSRNGQYVSNDVDTLLEGLYGWDTFGNCEHVHYRDAALSNAVLALKNNMSQWTDGTGNNIDYKDVRKVGVMIGGATENSSGGDGYGVTLPWRNFQSAGLNSVYGIRTNKGTPLNNDNLISWVDNASNNGTPFKDGTGTGFTKKYVATTEDAVYKTLMSIAEREMDAAPLVIEADDIYAEDVVIGDTIQDEFELDLTAPITAIIQDKNGNERKKVTISLDDATTETLADGSVRITTADKKFTIIKNTDGTTTVSYAYGDIQNTNTIKLDFGIQAKEDYIGSNNVLSNVGTPKINYNHTPFDQSRPMESYEKECNKTPEVNVPIRFDVTDGGKTQILVGDSTDLKDLSGEIAKDAEERVQAYDQINGTLSYEWELPDGTKVSAGSVKVNAGNIGEATFPDHSYTFKGETPGSNEIKLNVTFTPDSVKNNGNFSDDKTATAVNPLTKPGKVWVDVIDGESTRDIIIRKDWDGGDVPQGQEIKYRILADGKEVRTGTVSSDINWKELQKDLPAVDKETKKVINYTVEEVTQIPGYTVSYGTDIQTDTETTYGAKLQLKFTVGEGIGKDKPLKFTYTYGGITYNYTQDKNMHEQYQKTDNKNTHVYTIDIPGVFELDSKGQPMEIKVIGLVTTNDNKSKTITDAGSTATKITTGTTSTSTDVLVMKNTLNSTVSMTLHKTNASGTLSLAGAEFELLAADGSSVAKGTTDEKGILKLTDINSNQTYQLKETKAPDGYVLEQKVWEVKVDNSGNITLSKDGKVIEATDGVFQITNEAGYQLPESGGAGTLPYTLGGAILMIVSLMYGYSRKQKYTKGGRN